MRFRMSSFGYSFLLIALSLFIAACSGDSGEGGTDTSTNNAQSFPVDSTGGTVSYTHPDNSAVTVNMVVPAGAVPDGTVITVAPAGNGSYPADPDMIASTAFEFGPTGLSFAAPATLTITYDQSAVGALNESEFTINKLVTGAWEPQDSTVDEGANTVSTQIDGFSFWAILMRFFHGPIGPTDYVSTDVPKAIPDNDTIGITSDITVSGGARRIDELSVGVDVTHTWVNDLNLILIGPDATQVRLSVGPGNGANFVGTVFDDDAATLPTAPPNTGTFLPKGPLSSFDGRNANGTWNLKVVDSVSGGTGTIDGWSLTVTGGGTPDNTPPTITNIAPPVNCGSPGTLVGGTWIQVYFSEPINPASLILGGMLGPGGSRETETNGGVWNPTIAWNEQDAHVSNTRLNIKPNVVWSSGPVNFTIDAEDTSGNPLSQQSICYTVPSAPTPE